MTITDTIKIAFNSVVIDGEYKPMTQELIEQQQDGKVEAQTVTGRWESDNVFLCDLAIKYHFGAMVGGAMRRELRDWKVNLYNSRGTALGDNETSGIFTLFIR